MRPGTEIHRLYRPSESHNAIKKKRKLSQTPSMRVSTCETQRRHSQDQSQLSLINICGQRDFISSRRATYIPPCPTFVYCNPQITHFRGESLGGGCFFFFPRIQVLLRVFTQPQGIGGQRRLSDGLPTPRLGSAPGPSGAPPRPPRSGGAR